MGAMGAKWRHVPVGSTLGDDISFADHVAYLFSPAAMRPRTCILVLLAATIAACSPSPTERDIESALERQLKSVAGPWIGTSQPISLSFELTQATNGQLTGSGTMQESGVAGSTPIIVSGSYQRPTLVLGFTGMRRNGHSVRGDVTGQYASAGGVSATLVLTGVNGSTYSEQIPILLQEPTS